MAALAASLIAPGQLLTLALAWGWMALMTAEFFAPAWLNARPFAYLVSHMLVMPLIDLVVTGFEWMPHGTAPAALALFLLLSFANGCVLEIGRKLWAPEAERPGVETYSALLGPRRGAVLWFACIGVALVLLLCVGVATGAPLVTGAIGIVAAAATLRAGLRYRRAPTPKAAASVETAAGTWVFACYAAAGFVPFLRGFGL
jgi:4-hydroxybenzoate polyprenyltransferase